MPASFLTHPVSRKYDWLERLRRRRFASSERQSWIVIPPCVREPSASMMPKTRSKAFSKATNFWRSGEEEVRAVRSRSPSVISSALTQLQSFPLGTHHFSQLLACLQVLLPVSIHPEELYIRILVFVRDERLK